MDALSNSTDDLDNEADSLDAADELWLGDDLERLYQQAVDAMDAVEWATPARTDGDLDEDAAVADAAAAARASDGAELDDPTRDDTAALAARRAKSAGGVQEALAVLRDAADGTRSVPATFAEGASRAPTPRQIVEAALFVGGAPLTAKKLCSVLGGDFDHQSVERIIDDLNQHYARQARPYEIRLGEGGYRLLLKPEFERIRSRVYGLGPKEVKLSQEALEILALVAYKQPITAEEIEENGKPNSGGILRQLLRRELIALHRSGQDSKEVQYETTPRFLQLFGLGDLDELPRADELDFK